MMDENAPTGLGAYLLGALLVTALLLSLHQVVQGAVARGAQRRSAEAQNTETQWRCNAAHGVRARDECVTQHSQTRP